jgi:hypothetical protein
MDVEITIYVARLTTGRRIPMTKRMLETLALMLVFAMGVWAADSLFSGNWKLNPAKSKNDSFVPQLRVL